MITKAKGNVRLEDLQVGMQIVVNDKDYATLYTIKAIDGFNVKLVYFDSQGKEILGGSDGGWIDYSVCKYPNR